MNFLFLMIRRQTKRQFENTLTKITFPYSKILKKETKLSCN